MWKMIKNHDVKLTALLLGTGVLVVFVTMFVRLGGCLAVQLPEPEYGYTFRVEAISYITLKSSLAEVQLALPSLPEFSQSWTEEPQVIVRWRIRTRADETYEGRSTGVLAPPFSKFIFSIQDDLEAELGRAHSEQIFVNEYRYRIILDVTELQVIIEHAETGEVLDTFTQSYDPEQRPPETLAWS